MKETDSCSKVNQGLEEFDVECATAKWRHCGAQESLFHSDLLQVASVLGSRRSKLPATDRRVCCILHQTVSPFFLREEWRYKTDGNGGWSQVLNLLAHSRQDQAVRCFTGHEYIPKTPSKVFLGSLDAFCSKDQLSRLSRLVLVA